MTLKNKLMTAMVALGTLGAASTQAQDFKSESQKDLTTLLDQNALNHEILDIQEVTRIHDDLELAPGKYIKTEGYASTLYFLEGSDVFFLHKKEVPRLMKDNKKGSQTMNTEPQLLERGLNMPQTIRYIMVPAAWAQRGTSDANLEAKFQTLTDSLSNKSQEIGQGVGPTYNYLKCDNVTNINDINNSLYVAGNYYQTMQNILDYKFNNNNIELWAIYRTSSEFPAGASGNSIYSQGNNLIGATEGAYGIKGAGAPNNMNTQIAVNQHELVHLQGTTFADYNAHKASPANLMQPTVSATNIHPETRTNISGMGRQENGDNGAQSSCELLPLDLLSFTGEKLKNGNNQLTWSVEQEINVAGYEVEYSENGKDRKEIGTVAASNKAGKHNYHFEDISERKSLSYYRLTMVDQNGEQSISPIVVIRGSEKGSAIRYSPNPTNGELQLIMDESSKGLVKASVYTILGAKLMEMNIEVGEVFELPQLEGVYIIQSEDKNGQHHTQKVVKN